MKEFIRSKRNFPWKLSMHLLKESLLPMVCTIFAFSAMFMIRDVIDDITDFNGSGIPMLELLEYFGAKLLLRLADIIPISMLLSTSFMVVMLCKNNELTAIRAAGLSLAKTAIPIWIVAIVMCCAVFGINEISATLSNDSINRIQEQYLEHNKTEESRRLTYSNAVSGRDWFFADFSPAESAYRGVKLTIYDNLDGTKRKVRDITAQEATYENGVWLFRDGQDSRYAYTDGRMNPPVVEKFSDLAIEALQETPSLMKKHSREIGSMNISGLLDVIVSGFDYGPAKMKEANVMFWYRLTYPLASLVGALFGFALSIAVGRSGVLKGFASAVGLLILYFMTGQILRVWGINGNLPAIIAGAGSNIAFLIAGISALLNKR